MAGGCGFGCGCGSTTRIVQLSSTGPGGGPDAFIVPTAIDFQQVGGTNQYTVSWSYLDQNGLPQTLTDATPVTITGGAGGGTDTFIAPTSIDLTPVGNAGEYTVSFVYTDQNGLPVVLNDTTPIDIGVSVALTGVSWVPTPDPNDNDYSISIEWTDQNGDTQTTVSPPFTLPDNFWEPTIDANGDLVLTSILDPANPFVYDPCQKPCISYGTITLPGTPGSASGLTVEVTDDGDLLFTYDDDPANPIPFDPCQKTCTSYGTTTLPAAPEAATEFTAWQAANASAASLAALRAAMGL